MDFSQQNYAYPPFDHQMMSTDDLGLGPSSFNDLAGLGLTPSSSFELGSPMTTPGNGIVPSSATSYVGDFTGFPIHASMPAPAVLVPPLAFSTPPVCEPTRAASTIETADDNAANAAANKIPPEQIPCSSSEVVQVQSLKKPEVAISSIGKVDGNEQLSQPAVKIDHPIDVQLRNVVCSFSVPCHIDLRELARKTCHVYYEKSKGVLKKQMRNPKCYISIWSSGKATIIGCNSEENCKKASRVITRIMQKQFKKARLCNYKVNNIMATCRLPFGIRVEQIAAQASRFVNSNIRIQYEPELSVGMIWRSKKPKATLRIHTTGSITVTGAVSTADVIQSIENVYPVVKEFACNRQAPLNSRVAPILKKGGKAVSGVKKRRVPKDAGDYVDGGLEWIDSFEEEAEYFTDDEDEFDFEDFY